MPLDLELIDKEGNSQASDVNTIMGQLQTAGYNPKATTPDGMNIIMSDDQGDYTMPLQEVLQNVGVKLGHAKPQRADESGINAMWRYGVESLPKDDEVRKAFISSKLQKEAGVQNPQVTGSGSDWYFFNPDQRKWMALTSGEGITSASLASLVPTAIKGVGAATGGILGTISGGGLLSAGTGAAGAVFGGRLGDDLNQAIAGRLDPEIQERSSKFIEDKYGEGMWNRIKGNLSENKLDMALDGVTGGFAGAVPKLFAKGAASQATRGTGAVLNTTGKATQTAANIVDNPLGRGLIRSPVTGALEAGAFLAQAPDYATRKGVPLLKRGADWLSKKTGGKWGEGTSKFADELMQTRGPSDELLAAAKDAAEGMAKTTKKVTPPIGAEEAMPSATTRDILGNLGEKFGQKLKPKGFMQPGNAYTQEAAEVLSKQEVAKNAIRGGRAGESAGAALKNVADTGAMIENGLDYATKKALGGVRNAGKAASATGRGMQTLGTLTNPWENRLLTRQGLDYASKRKETPEELRELFKKQAAKQLYGGR